MSERLGGGDMAEPNLRDGATSKSGECQVTMARTARGVSGTFNCSGIKDEAGNSAGATGSFAT